jgi:hypothetical protein
LPAAQFRFFRQETRTVDDAGLVQVNGSYYAALPAPLHRPVTVRIYTREIEILDDRGEVLRRHDLATRKGQFVLPQADRLFNPSRETARLLARVAKLGPASTELATALFARQGRPGHRAIYGLANLPRHYAREAIEAACTTVLTLAVPSYRVLKRLLEQRARAAAEHPSREASTLQQTGEEIRALGEYRAFFEAHAHGAAEPSLTPRTERNHDDDHVTA